ncbi:MAG: hypothetical protein Q8O56_16675 [Solirubrobacteraceae bacterium]|nr:hypothetical protein [Solirubrobacteraceae bacterium]
MGDLRVTRDGAYYGVSIRGVLESGAGEPLYVAVLAQRVEWCDPDDPDAGPDGWIRSQKPGGTMQGELELRFTREKVHERALAQLEAWRANPPENLVGVSSVEQQYVGLIDQADGKGIGIQHDERRQDRSAARAYATWSSGKLRAAD